MGDCPAALKEIRPPVVTDDSDLVLVMQIYTYGRCGFRAEPWPLWLA